MAAKERIPIKKQKPNNLVLKEGESLGAKVVGITAGKMDGLIHVILQSSDKTLRLKVKEIDAKILRFGEQVQLIGLKEGIKVHLELGLNQAINRKVTM